jgi:hypothetical protein
MAKEDAGTVMRALSEMEARLNEQLNKLTERVTASMNLTPAGIVTINKPKVAPADEDDALVEGTAATFTFVQHQPHGVRRFFAIGAAHCAFYYKSLGEGTFVFLPESVARMEVSRVYYHPKMCHPCITDAEDTYKMDFVAVEVSVPMVDDDWKNCTRWPDAQNRPHSALVVAGKSNSGLVSGTNMCLKNSYYAFVEQTGEPGQSGTLMFTDEGLVAGVYGGVLNSKKKQQPRAWICPLPSLNDLDSSSPVQDTSLNSILLGRVVNGHTFAKRMNIDHVHGTHYVLTDEEDQYHGVVIEDNFDFCGAYVCGDSRLRM